MQMQAQEGAAACEVFTIAVATVLRNEQDLTVVHLEQKDMHDHRITCFQKGKLTFRES